MLSTKIKANSITHLTDARYFAALEVEWLGFQMIPGADYYLPAQQVAAFQEWVDGVKICGEFELTDLQEVNTAIDLLGLKAVQLSMFTPLDVIAEAKKKVEVLQELVVENYSDLFDLQSLMETNQSAVDYFILQCSKGGVRWSDLESGTPFDLEQLKKWADQYPILLDIQLDTDISGAQVLEEVALKGFTVIGGEEEKVGLKSFDELDDFFESLEVLI